MARAFCVYTYIYLKELLGQHQRSFYNPKFQSDCDRNKQICERSEQSCERSEQALRRSKNKCAISGGAAGAYCTFGLVPTCTALHCTAHILHCPALSPASLGGEIGYTIALSLSLSLCHFSVVIVPTLCGHCDNLNHPITYNDGETVPGTCDISRL